MSIEFIIEKGKRQGLVGGEGLPGPLDGCQRTPHVVRGDADQDVAAIPRTQFHEHRLKRFMQRAHVKIMDHANDITLSPPEFIRRVARLFVLEPSHGQFVGNENRR